MRLIASVLSAGAVMALAGSASAAVVYSTGFEGPAFSTGGIDGQNGWFVDSPNTSFFTVSNAQARSGTQAARLVASTTGANSGWAWWDPLNVDPLGSGSPVVQISWSQLITSPQGGTASSGGFGIDIFDDSVAFMGRVQTSGATGQLLVEAGTLGFFNTGVVLNDNTWYDLRIVMDFTTATYDVYVGNTLAASAFPFTPGTGVIGDVDLRKNQQAAAFDSAYFDNLRIETFVPAPSAALALGGLGLMGLRRRR